MKASSRIQSAAYDMDFYASDSILMWAKMFEERLPEDVTFLISASCSGAAIASAILVMRGIKREAEGNPQNRMYHCHIHPAKRISHRGVTKTISGNKPGCEDICAFVDDFVSTGRTCGNALRQFYKYISERYPGSKNKPILRCIMMSGGRDDKRKGGALCQSLADEFKTRFIFANGEKGHRYIKPKEVLPPPEVPDTVEPETVEIYPSQQVWQRVKEA